MAIDLMDMVRGAMGGEGMKQISGLLGADEQQAGSALGAGLPAILAGLMKQASSPAGAQEVFDSASKFDGGMLGNIAGALGGGNHTALIQTGMGLLGSIFGSQQSGLMGTIARMSGMNQSAVGSLLGIVAPMVMSALSKAKASNNLDAGGMASLLMTQRDHVTKALPDELKSELKLNSFLDQGADMVRNAGASVAGAAAGAAGAAGNAAHATAGAATEAARSGGGMMGKLIPLVVVAALAWFGFQYFGGSTAVDDAGTAVTDAVNDAMPSVDLDALTGSVTSAVGNVTEAVGGITDEASATAAIDPLRNAATSLEGLNLDSLPAPAKTAISGVLAPLMTTLQGALDKAYAIPGVEGIIKPVVDPMMEKLTALGR